MNNSKTNKYFIKKKIKYRVYFNSFQIFQKHSYSNNRAKKILKYFVMYAVNLLYLRAQYRPLTICICIPVPAIYRQYTPQ